MGNVFGNGLLLDVKSIVITFVLVVVVRVIISWRKWKRTRRFLDIDDEPCEFENLTPEEKKLYQITKVNTNINREMPAEQEQYVKEAYKIIYGNEGKNIMNGNSSNSSAMKHTTTPKKKLNVSFSEELEYSRN